MTYCRTWAAATESIVKLREKIGVNLLDKTVVSSSVGTDSRSVVARRLLTLRLALAAAISVGIGFVHWGLGWELSLGIVGVALALLLTHSAFLIVRRMQLSDPDLWCLLAIDATALLLVVSETGRTANPFIYYLLVLIALGASVLTVRACSIFTFGCCAAYTALMWSDVRGHFDHRDADYQLHLLGMWVNFVGSAVLISLALARLTRALREREAAFACIRESALRDEQLIGIGTLAASTVHALGTPLSTLSVLLGDMRDSLGDPAQKDDIALMLEQIDRCRSTMQKLSLLAEGGSGDPQPMSIQLLISMLKEHYSLAIPSVKPRFEVQENVKQRQLRCDLLLQHALVNLVDNAVQAAVNIVSVRFFIYKDSLLITIENDGNRFPSDVLARWGKPVSSRRPGGLGIGVFLANSSIERLGGIIQVRQPSAGGGDRTAIDVILPLIHSGDRNCQ